MSGNEYVIRRTKIYAITILFVSTVFTTAILSYVDANPVKKIAHDKNVVHIDLNNYEDVLSSYNYSSSTPLRYNRYNHEFDNIGFDYEIQSGNAEIKFKSISLLKNSTNNGIVKDLLFSNDNEKIQMKNNPSNKNIITYSDNDNFELKYINTVNGIKELIILNSPPENTTSDIIYQAKIDMSAEKLKINSDDSHHLSEWKISKNKINIIDKKSDDLLFSIFPPVLWDSPTKISTQDGNVFVSDSIKHFELYHRYKVVKKIMTYEIIIPFDVYDSNVNYPLFIDPSITTFNGYAEYRGYDNGSISLKSGNSVVWYHDVDKTIYLESDICIGLGEKLIFRNVNILANKTGLSINVTKEGKLFIIDNSTISRTENSDGYSIKYENSSIGRIFDSIIENINSTAGFEIQSSNVVIDSSIFRYNQPSGIFINQSSPKIINSDFYLNDVGIQVSPFSNPQLIGNRINNTNIGINWESANIFDDFATLENIDKLIGTQVNNNTIEFANILENYALSCPCVSVDSEYSSSYHKGRMYDGITDEIWWNQWNSNWNEPHYAIFDFQELKNVTKFVITHRSDYPTYDYKIQKWNSTSSSWSTIVTVTNNDQAVTTHILDQEVETRKIKLYITDSNNGLDCIARIREFEIYGEPINSSYHYVMSTPFDLYGDSVYDKLILDKNEPGNSKILISVLDTSTNETISGYNQVDTSTINLKNIDTTKYRSIKVKAEFVIDGESKPTLSSWKLLYSPLHPITNEFIDYSNIIEMNDVTIRSGKVQLGEDTYFQELWEPGWRNNWTITKKYDRGFVEPVFDHWDGSNFDMYLEGTSNLSSSGHDGWVDMVKYFPDISVDYQLNTHFHGVIDAHMHNYADVFIKHRFSRAF